MTQFLHNKVYYGEIMEIEKIEPFITGENINHLKNFGLSNEESKVYLSLLKRGNRGEVVGRIKDELEIGRTTIYAIMERLYDKGWVFSEEISQNPRRIKYVANPPLEVLNKIIKMSEIELENQKRSTLFIGDKLDIAYQGAKKLTLNSAHPGAYKYLKLLVDEGFFIKSEVIEYTEGSEYYLSYDYELKGPKGFPKECGLIIIEYHRDIEDDVGLIAESFKLFKSKTDYEIRRDKIPGFQDVKLEDTKFDKYLGANVLIKLKIKKKWWKAGHQAILPIKNKIFFIFGAVENFQILMDAIQNAEKFRHLV